MYISNRAITCDHTRRDSVHLKSVLIIHVIRSKTEWFLIQLPIEQCAAFSKFTIKLKHVKTSFPPSISQYWTDIFAKFHSLGAFSSVFIQKPVCVWFGNIQLHKNPFYIMCVVRMHIALLNVENIETDRNLKIFTQTNAVI